MRLFFDPKNLGMITTDNSWYSFKSPGWDYSDFDLRSTDIEIHNIQLILRLYGY